MGKIIIDDDCFAPRKFIYLEYKGPDPFALIKAGNKLFRRIFEVGSSKIAERRFMWDWTGDPIQLYEHFVIRKEVSNYTTFYFSLRIVGFKSKSRNEGSIRIEFEAQARHQYESNNWFMTNLWWLYWYIFYAKARQNYLKLCKEYADKLLTAIKEMYK
ncbi:MAG TPA: hypothetical protein ENG42_02440, partial [Candidatus Aenigmarchaeota archaeon]|nr:hypothetical protein [Candidatus Aenigmarchaeota archaeon]